MALVAILMLAAKKLVPQGMAKLSINEGSKGGSKAGASLLATLSEEIFSYLLHVVVVVHALCVNVKF